MDKRLQEVIDKYNKILIFSGAGVSTDSEISDYKNGDLYYSKLYEDYFTHQEIMDSYVFNKNKNLFFEYYISLLNNLKNKKSNYNHYFAQNLDRSGKLLGVITQNIDGLYSKLIDNEKLCEIHGNAFEFVCCKCKRTLSESETYLSKKGIMHSKCHDFLVKPNVVLYGEPFNDLKREQYFNLLDEADCILVIGTELKVITHNNNIAKSKAYKVLLNKDNVQLERPYVGLYSNYKSVECDWDLQILGDLKNIIEE